MAKLDEAKTPKTPEKAKPQDDKPQSKLRGRELVYIDSDDDVTSIVGRIKSAEDAVVALVPPKRSNILQSVVNLKLFNKAAKDAGKVLAIVTADQSLTNLAAGLAIPVAKSINAQATVQDMADPEEVSDIIDGDETYTDDRGRKNGLNSQDISTAVAAIETDDNIRGDYDGDGTPDSEQADDSEESPRKRIKKPTDGAARRKKLIVGGVIALAALILVVWAVVFAPSAAVTVRAKTSSLDITRQINLITDSGRDADEGVAAPVIQTKKHSNSVQFEATGTKETGEKAKGTVAICNKQDYVNSKSGASNTINLPAGTVMYADGVRFTTDADISVEGSQTESDRNCVDMKVTAESIGESGNIAKNTLLTISGYDRSKLAASAEDAFTGGSKKTVKVVQQSDVDAAVAKLNDKDDADSIKSELAEKMPSSTTVIDSSFTVSSGDVQVSPAVGQEANGTANASVETTYMLVGIDTDDIKAILRAAEKAKVSSGQRVYSDGSKKIKFNGFKTVNNGYTVQISTTAQVGPKLDEDEIKAAAAGKKSEEIKAQIKKIDGVSDVDVVISPFWVSQAPAADKIKVNFAVDD